MINEETARDCPPGEWLSIVDVPATAETARQAGLEAVAQVIEVQHLLIQELTPA